MFLHFLNPKSSYEMLGRVKLTSSWFGPCISWVKWVQKKV